MNTKKLLSVILSVTLLIGSVLISGASPYDADKTPIPEGVETLAPRFPFSDVPYDSWYFDSVWYVTENDLMQGTGGENFAPDAAMTRAELVTLLCRLCGGERAVTDTFVDVDSSKWYAEYIGWAEKSGVFTGTSATAFSPERKITRAEVATALSRYFDYIELTIPESDGVLSAFADADKIADWAKSHVENLRTTGLMQGNSNGEFMPTAEMTRKEAATLVARLDRATLKLTAPEFIAYGASSLYSNIHGVKAGDLSLTNAGEYGLLSLGSGTLNFDYRYFLMTPVEYPVITVLFDSDFKSADVKFATLNNTFDAKVSSAKVTLDGKTYYSASIDLGSIIGNNIMNEIVTDNNYGVGKYAGVSFTFSGEAPKVLCATFAQNTDAADKSVSEAALKDVLKTNVIDEVFYEKADDKLIAKYEKEAQDKINEIMSADGIDPATIKGTCYYISSINGDDSNDGLSPETPWKTVNNLYTIIGGGWKINHNLKPGDGVFFERGSEFNSHEELSFNTTGYHAILLTPGVTYSVYGEGDKPLFTNRLVTSTPTGKWKAVAGYPNVWQLDENMKFDASRPQKNEIGAVVVNGGEMWGIRTAKYDDSYSFSTDRGVVTNGRDIFKSQAMFEDLSSLKNDLQFYYDRTDGNFYMYCDDGNPGEVFDDIKFSVYGDIIVGGGIESGGATVVDNLSVKYGARHGMAIGGNNFTAQNCEIGWIGGIDIGNGIEAWGNVNNYTVKDCYFYQCYDDCATAQHMGDGTNNGALMNNITFTGNVCTYTTMAFELWSAHFSLGSASPENLGQNSIIKNTTISDNYLLYMGYGFGHQRSYEYHPGKGGGFMDCAGFNFQQFSNVSFENNVCVHTASLVNYAQHYKTNGDRRGVEFKNNLYIASNNTYIARTNLANRTERVLYPYNERSLAYLQDLGIETGSKFYYYEGYLTDAEAETGVMH